MLCREMSAPDLIGPSQKPSNGLRCEHQGESLVSIRVPYYEVAINTLLHFHRFVPSNFNSAKIE
jgi:hypothetical protein